MNKTYIIAEAGVNHNGSIELAERLIDVAAESGSDAIKFQLFKASHLTTQSSEKARYQKNASKDKAESQFEMLKKLEINIEQQRALKFYADKKGIEFLSTPFDNESLYALANQFQVKRLKISSGDLTNAPLLLAAARTGIPTIISTGMANLAEIEQALGVLAYGYCFSTDKKPNFTDFQKAYQSDLGAQGLKEKVSILHCTTEYPAPFSEVNLRVIQSLTQCFGLRVGYSDHTAGIHVSLAAVALGATIIEKHFTLDKTMEGPDHAASLEPDELKLMVENIRDIDMALGSPIKKPSPSEIHNKSIARRSIVAARPIQKGEMFDEDNLIIKRPETGLAPIYYWDLLGKPADKEYAQDEVLKALC